jgi:hypothetical protein
MSEFIFTPSYCNLNERIPFHIKSNKLNMNDVMCVYFGEHQENFIVYDSHKISCYTPIRPDLELVKISIVMKDETKYTSNQFFIFGNKKIKLSKKK